MFEPTNLLEGLKTYGINTGGHKIGQMVAESLWKRPKVRAWVAQNPVMAKAISEGLLFTTSLLELGGKHPLVILANNISEVIATESTEIVNEILKDPVAAQAKIDAKVGEVLEGDAWLAGVVVHKHKKCSVFTEYVADMTPPERKSKDDKVVKEPSRARVTQVFVEDALQAGKLLCPVCYPPVFDLKATKKPEGKTFTELLIELHAKEPMLYHRQLIAPDAPYPHLIGKDPGLEKKFKLAFYRNRGYDDLVWLFKQPNELWHKFLDGWIGDAAEAANRETRLQKELRETEQMFENFFDHCKKVPAWAEEKKRTINERRRDRKEEWDEEDRAYARKAHRRSLVLWGTAFMAILALVLIHLHR